MSSWYAWLGLAAVAAALGFVASYFSVRTVRWVTVVIAVGLVISVTAYGLHGGLSLGMPPSGPADLQTAFAKSADAIAAALLHPLWMGHSVPAPGRVGWAIITVLILLGYRQLEARAFAQQAPVLDTSRLSDDQPSIPVTGSADPTDGQRHDQLAAELKFRLSAMEVRSPAILPGGSRSEGLASIAEDSGVAGGDLLAAIIRALSLLWPGPRRWLLRVWVEPAVAGQEGGKDAETRVTVELDDPRAGVTVASKTVAAASLDDAASMVAGYVARQVFARDPTAPPWVFGAADGRDLGVLLIARQERVYADSWEALRGSRQRQIKVLRTVTSGSRCAGVVRYELAQLHDLGRNHLTALRLHAVNREQYPRFFRGRYRLAMSLEMAANRGLTFSNPPAVKYMLTEILSVLHRCGLAARAACGDEDLVPSEAGHGHYRLSDAVCLELLEAARSELRVTKRQLRLPFLLWAALTHRDERTVWRPYRRLRVRQSFRDGASVAELLIAVRIVLNDSSPQPRVNPSDYAHALRMVAAITSDAAPVKAVLRGERQPAAARRTVVAPREQVRVLPWLRRTASWQAAYNAACIYSALAQQGLADEGDVVTCLQRAIDSRDSEMERAYDWIAYDPDFLPLKNSPPGQFPAFKKFLRDCKRRDYPRMPRPSQAAADEGDDDAEDEPEDGHAPGLRAMG
jgi:hypothetical protein